MLNAPSGALPSHRDGKFCCVCCMITFENVNALRFFGGWGCWGRAVGRQRAELQEGSAGGQGLEERELRSRTRPSRRKGEGGVHGKPVRSEGGRGCGRPVWGADPPGTHRRGWWCSWGLGGTRGVRVVGRGADRGCRGAAPVHPPEEGCKDGWTDCRGCEHSGQRAVGLQLVSGSRRDGMERAGTCGGTRL